MPRRATDNGRVAGATYRLQFNRDFTLRDARRILPYLKRLGISHIYSSPLLTARAGSNHCYDVVNHQELNPDIGSPKDFEEFVRDSQKLQLGIILDIVPNHMAADDRNLLWKDVLKKGVDSAFSGYFDIDWERGKFEQKKEKKNKKKLVLPFLGGSEEEAVRAGNVHLEYKEGENRIGKLTLRVYDREYPLSKESLRIISRMSRSEISDSSYETSFLMRDGGRLESPSFRYPTIHRRSARSYKRISQGNLRASVRTINESPRLLKRILSMQNYNLVYWLEGLNTLNYRRFFTINDLVAIRQELPRVFEESHELIFKWLSQGKIQGLRVDHPDGLWNPTQYFERLQNTAIRKSRPNSSAAVGERPYVIAEKILTDSETLPEDWKVDGTTGYDFASDVNQLFVDSRNEQKFDRIYRKFTGERSKDYREVCFQSKKLIVERYMNPDVDTLCRMIPRVFMRGLRDEKFVKQAIALVAACFPVYRSYISPSGRLSAHDRYYWKDCFAYAKLKAQGERELLVAIRLLELVVLCANRFRNSYTRSMSIAFIMRFQQLTSAVLAKGLEDTAFYRFNRIASVNEVGSDPSIFGISRQEFHKRNQKRARNWPHTMLTTSTHDSKRSEDVRARINVISEFPDEWSKAVHRWSRTNAKYRDTTTGCPSKNDEYLLYQTLVGSLPLAALRTRSDSTSLDEAYVDRIVQYMQKASREAKQETSWIFPNEEYEGALESFVRNSLSPHNDIFLDDLTSFTRKISFFGFLNSISQIVLKLTSPGVPDFFQGSELWDFRLVDPDNRNRIDFEERKSKLNSIDDLIDTSETLFDVVKKLSKNWKDGRLKMFIMQKTLELRRSTPQIFANGRYTPLAVMGERKRNVMAFSRVSNRGSQEVITLVTRFLASATNDCEIPVGRSFWGKTLVKITSNRGRAENGKDFVNTITGEPIRMKTDSKGNRVINLADAFSVLPVAILTKC